MDNQVVLSVRSKTKFVYDGFSYVYDKKSKNETTLFWRCDQKHNGCRARIHTTVDHGFLKKLNEHSHESSAALIEVLRVRNELKTRAKETMEPPAQIINHCLATTSEAAKGQLVSKAGLRKIVQRTRNAIQNAPANPESLLRLVIPEEYKMYNRELFLLGDSQETNLNTDRILIFGRESHITWSQEMKMLFMDGTFRLAPPLFAQIYVLLAERRGNNGQAYVFPVIYGLLPNKRRATYDAFFSMLKQIWPEINPDAVAVDFELASISALQDAFPQVQIFGCLFHLMQNLRKHINENNLTRNYNRDADFALSARMIVSLAFVPIPDLEAAVEALAQYLPNELHPVLNWFEDAYIGRLNRNGTRRAPMFPPQIWSVYDRTINGLGRTNNFAEAAHRRLQTEFSVDHPSIWKFIDGLRKAQHGVDFEHERFIAGNDPTRKRRKYRDCDARILNIVRGYPEDRTLVEYLRGIAHNLRME